VHIGELVLHGFAPGDRHRIAGAVEHELARLMSAEDAPRWRVNPPALDRVEGGAFRIKPGARPEAAGAEIARAVFGSLRQHAGAQAGVAGTRRFPGGPRP
jgi:hypothetical protein